MAFVRARTKYNKTKKKAKFEYKSTEGHKLRKLAKSNPRKFWKILKKKKKENKSDNLKANNFNNHSKNVYDHSNLNLSENVHKNDDTANNDKLLDSKISDDEIRKAILSQNNNKSPVIDQFTAEILKCSIDIILPFWKGIYNRILNFLAHEYPPSWCNGINTPASLPKS